LGAHFNKERTFINLLYAAWGYGGPGEKEHAQRAGFSVLNQKELIDMI
jgi:hypothetical protein